MKSFKKITILMVILVSVLFFACSGSSEDTSRKDRTVVFGMQGNPDSLDPHLTAGTLTFMTIKSFYDTLVEPDKDGNIIPALAESWTVSDDNLVWTFKLRSGVKFHNGDVFSSADAKATLERVLDPATAAPKAVDFGPVDNISAPDPQTLVITLKTPFSPILATLASGWGAMLPASLIQSGHDFASKPVGTGPYSMVEWIRDGRVVLKKNPNYWMPGIPKIENIHINIIPEMPVAVQGLESGQVDIVYNIMEEYIPSLDANPKVTLEKTLSAMVLVMAMNCSAPGLDDVRLRQAVTHAIDKQTVLDVAYSGGQVTGTFMDPANAYYKDFTSLYPYDPDKARSIINSLGSAAKREFVMVIPQNYALHMAAGEIYQEMLRAVGLNVRIQLVDWSTWNSDVYRASKYDFTVIGHTGKLDPDGALNGYGSNARYVKWLNSECFELINKARTVSSIPERKALYDKALELMAKEVPFMFLGSPWIFNGYQSDLQGFRMTPKLDSLDFRWLEFK